MTERRDEGVKMPLGPEEGLRALLQVDPESSLSPRTKTKGTARTRVPPPATEVGYLSRSEELPDWVCHVTHRRSIGTPGSGGDRYPGIRRLR